MRFLSKTNHKSSITTTFCVVVMLVLLVASCGKEKTDVVEVAFDPENTYTMKTTDITELISESGIIRYKIIAEEWYSYDKAEEPYWLLPKGGYLERFDSLLNKDASIKADTVFYYTKKGLWKLVGNVEYLSLQGEKFNTEQLFMDEKADKAYSDKYIRVEQEDKIITGIGFESNMSMTKYNVFNSQGSFPVKDTQPDTTTTAADSIPISPLEMTPN